jgi:flagellar biosynthesis/type III secretory pathway protein FliH
LPRENERKKEGRKEGKKEGRKKRKLEVSTFHFLVFTQEK